MTGIVTAMHLHKSEYVVLPTPLSTAQCLVSKLHYTRGGSNTAVRVDGLYHKDDLTKCLGVAWWLPPTKVAAQSVHPEWTRVLSLTRLVLDPSVPTNGASFLLSKSIRNLKKEGKYKALVTYADESQGHTGNIYRACNWTYVGRTGPYPRWISSEGRQVSPKATKNRTKQEMLDLGHTLQGRFYKHKFVYILGP